jgi:hypothetical protein
MLMGSNGYEYVGYTYPQAVHRNLVGAVNNKDGCLECHFKETSNYVLGGHSFNMEYGEGAEEEFNLAGCNVASCHDGDVEDDFNYEGVQDSVEVLLELLKGKLIAVSLIDSSGHSFVPAGEDTFRLVGSADSAGAVWNFLLVEEDRSEGVHNRQYIEGLLRSSIMYIDGNLPQPAPPSIVSQRKRY